MEPKDVYCNQCGSILSNVELQNDDHGDSPVDVGFAFTGKCPRHGEVRQKTFIYKDEAAYIAFVNKDVKDSFTKRLEANILCYWCGEEWAHIYGREVKETAEKDGYGVCGKCNESTTLIIVADLDGKYDAAFRRKVKKMFERTSFELRFADDDEAWSIG